MITRSLDATSTDEIGAVLELFAIVYGRRLSEAFYRWRFIDNPYDSPMVSLLWDGSVLAGHYSASPTTALIEGERVPAAQSMTTMTHPSYRNQGVFTRLAEHLYRELSGRGTGVIWGLPNAQSHYGFVNKLEWHDIDLLATMTCPVTAAIQPRSSVVEVTDVPKAVSDLFVRTSSTRSFPSVKDEQYMRWRYMNHPEQKYFVFTMGEPMDAFLVAKEYSTRDGRALEVVDWLFAAPRVAGDAFAEVLGWARMRDYAMVRTWMRPTDPAFAFLEKRGFVPREPLVYFGGRSLGSRDFSPETWNGRNWCVTMGNSDNY